MAEAKCEQCGQWVEVKFGRICEHERLTPWDTHEPCDGFGVEAKDVISREERYLPVLTWERRGNDCEEAKMLGWCLYASSYSWAVAADGVEIKRDVSIVKSRPIAENKRSAEQWLVDHGVKFRVQSTAQNGGAK